MSGRLAALLAWLLPSRGRHTGPETSSQRETRFPPPDAEDEDVSPADLTMFDLPTGRVPPYVWPDDEDGDRDRRRKS